MTSPCHFCLTSLLGDWTDQVEPPILTRIMDRAWIYHHWSPASFWSLRFWIVIVLAGSPVRILAFDWLRKYFQAIAIGLLIFRSIGLLIFFRWRLLFCSNSFGVLATWSILLAWFSCSRSLFCLRDLSCRDLCFPATRVVFCVRFGTWRHPTPC